MKSLHIVKSKDSSDLETRTLTRLLRDHHLSVRWQISRWIDDPQTVDDIAQDVFVAWLQTNRDNPDKFQGSDDPIIRAWLLRVARNSAVDWLRRKTRQPMTTAIVEHLAADPSSSPEGPDRHFYLDDGLTRLQALQRCLGLLQSHHREIVEEFYQQGKSSELIAARLGKESSNVRMILSRIRRALGKCIQRHMEPHS